MQIIPRVGALLSILLALAVACKKQETPVADTAPPAATDTAESKNERHVAASLTGPPPAGGSIVQVEFDDTVAFLLPINGDPQRAVALTGRRHGASSKHAVEIRIPPIKAADLPGLQTVVGGVGAIKCDVKRCLIEPTVGLAMEIRDTADGIVSPSPVEKTYLFETLVPKLVATTQAYGSKPLSTLDPALAAAFPPTNGDFSLYVDLNGGTLNAKAACGVARFVNNSRTAASAYQKFASALNLTGTTAAEATVVFRSSAGSQVATFEDPRYVQIFIRNRPANPNNDHFHVLKDLGADKDVVMPWIDHTKDCEREVKANVIGCAATEWP